MGETREAKIRIAAAPERVWGMVSDITRMGEWSPENQGGDWLDGATTAAVGARFKGRNRHGKSKWSTTCVVEVADPGREFTFLVGGKKPTTRWRYLFTPADAGADTGDGDAARTDIVESFELVKPLSRFDRLVTRVTTGVKDREGDMEEGMRVTLARLKEAAESAP